MSPRNLQRRRPGGGGRAPTGWAGFVGADATVAAGTKQIVGSFVPLPGFSHETAVRVVGDWAVGGFANSQVALGACVVTDAAFAVGAAALPDPISDISDDIWMFVSSISQAVLTDVPVRDRFDSHAMRKVEEGSRLVVMISNNATTVISFSIYIRVLAKLAVRS